MPFRILHWFFYDSRDKTQTLQTGIQGSSCSDRNLSLHPYWTLLTCTPNFHQLAFSPFFYLANFYRKIQLKCHRKPGRCLLGKERAHYWGRGRGWLTCTAPASIPELTRWQLSFCKSACGFKSYWSTTPKSVCLLRLLLGTLPLQATLPVQDSTYAPSLPLPAHLPVLTYSLLSWCAANHQASQTRNLFSSL